MLNFKWRYPSGLRVARFQVKHEIDAMFIANALVHTYAQDTDADELPTDLTARAISKMIREKLSFSGIGWNECGAWDEVEPGEEDAFRDWASATVRRCFPQGARDCEQFNKSYPEVTE